MYEIQTATRAFIMLGKFMRETGYTPGDGSKNDSRNWLYEIKLVWAAELEFVDVKIEPANVPMWRLFWVYISFMNKKHKSWKFYASIVLMKNICMKFPSSGWVGDKRMAKAMAESEKISKIVRWVYCVYHLTVSWKFYCSILFCQYWTRNFYEQWNERDEYFKCDKVLVDVYFEFCLKSELFFSFVAMI